ncbi:MAG: hypothetical protein C0426_16570 [Rhodobacter sp.]|nr:hypothetical protein [Rhodobacter sp.]
MKTLLLTTALAAGFAVPSLAQDAASPFQTEAAGPALAASEVIGARIYASESALDADAYQGVQQGWEDIGEVHDIILGRDGTVDAVLVDIGGFLGMGERQVAVDMAALRIVQDDATDADDWFLVLQSDRATLEGAPEYIVPGMTGTTADAELPADAPVAADTATEAQTEGAAPAVPTIASDGTMTLPDGYAVIERDTLTAELLTGADVRGSDDTSIAEVSDLVLTGEGQVTDVILDVGGFLGIGARSVAIPMDRVTVAQAEGGAVRIWVNMTREELEALPEHKVQ